MIHKLYLLGRGADPDVASWSAPTTANPNIDPALIEREPRDRIRRQVLGRHVLDVVRRSVELREQPGRFALARGRAARKRPRTEPTATPR